MFKRTTIRERANAALTGLGRSSSAMSMLRSRLEARIESILSNGIADTDCCQELNRVLDLVKKGEVLLSQMSEKVDSARYLQEFIQIVASATNSINEIKGDMQELAPKAEAALSVMHEAIMQVSTGINGESSQEIDPPILEHISSSLAIRRSDLHLGGPYEEAQQSKCEPIESAKPRQISKQQEIEKGLPA